MDLTRDRWEGLSPDERESLARRLTGELPSDFRFLSLGRNSHGSHVARYQRGSRRFVLVPGGPATLGYDATRPREPNRDELESWQDTAEEYGIGQSLQEYVATVTLRPRQVELPPLLVEVSAGELGWERIDTGDPEVVEILRKYPQGGDIQVCQGSATTRVRRREGPVIAERSRELTHTELVADLAAEGYRFPTPDEWEYLCGAGAPTLFRWGDHVPCDRYPTDISPAEADWRRRWVVSGGELEYPAEGFQSDWDHHRRPNALGLYIAQDPYQCELTAEIGTTRGGDGGGMICGGAGFFVGWLTLATAYFEEDACRIDPEEPVMPEYTIGRRVLELG